MSFRKASVIGVLLLLVFALFAHIDAFAAVGGMGRNGFGKMGAITNKKAAPLVSCASTGVFDLSNKCNDIYFIGALR